MLKLKQKPARRCSLDLPGHKNSTQRDGKWRRGGGAGSTGGVVADAEALEGDCGTVPNVPVCDGNFGEN
jgi:hypothetical protein